MATRNTTKRVNTEERINNIETILGFDKDGKRNGNGILSLIEKVSERQTESWHEMEKMRTDIDAIELKLNQINDNWKSLSFDIKTLNENIKNMEWRFSSFENKIKEHSTIMNDVMTPSKIRNMAKDFGLLVTTLIGIGTLFGIIAFLYNKINGK